MIYYGFAFEDIYTVLDEIERICRESKDQAAISKFIHTAYSASSFDPTVGVIGVIIDDRSCLFNPIEINRENLQIKDPPEVSELLRFWMGLPNSIQEQANNLHPCFLMFENNDD